MTWIVLVAIDAYVIFVGLAVGSFVNLAADRLPRGESLVHPASHCTACGRQLNLVDLTPVLGYVLRGGRCATCRTHIGVSSPLVEASCGALMVIPVLWTPGLATAFAGISLTTGFGAGVILISLLRSRSGSRPDARSRSSRLAH